MNDDYYEDNISISEIINTAREHPYLVLWSLSPIFFTTFYTIYSNYYSV
jgi:hypothetical protein